MSIHHDFFSLFKNIISKKSKFQRYYYSNEEASNVILHLAGEGNFMYSSEWDDFESIPHTNIEAELALQLCFWFANKYPSEEDIPTVIGASEKANPYFKAIGLALKYNNFSNLEHQEIIEQFKGKSYNTALPEIIENILMKYID